MNKQKILLGVSIFTLFGGVKAEVIDVSKEKKKSVKKEKKYDAITALMHRTFAEPLQSRNNISSKQVYSRVMSIPTKYYVREKESSHTNVRLFSLYSVLDVKNLEVEPKPTQLFDLKYDVVAAKCYAKEGNEWKIRSEHKFFKMVKPRMTGGKTLAHQYKLY